jgi:putative ABC transport system permease protein
MSGPLRLALAHAIHYPVRSCLLAAAVFVSVLLPVATAAIFGAFERNIVARAASTPLVAGAPGSRFDLVMSSLYFRDVPIRPLTMKDWRSLSDSGLADAIPLNTHFTARGTPLVATTPEYFEFRSLAPREGTLPRRIGEVVIGASAAARLQLRAGDSIFSDQRELFDLTKPPAVKLRVAGVLALRGTPDDDAVFADIRTASVLEGLAHGHADAGRDVPGSLILDRTDESVVVSEELVDYNEFNASNFAAFHAHGDPDALPITSIIFLPRDAKSASILKARTNSGDSRQVIVPEEAVRELLGYVARIRRLLEVLSVVLVVFTAVMVGLVTALSIRVRAREIETLRLIGASRATIAAIFVWEILIVVLIGAAFAASLAALLAYHPPDLVKLL